MIGDSYIRAKERLWSSEACTIPHPLCCGTLMGVCASSCGFYRDSLCLRGAPDGRLFDRVKQTSNKEATVGFWRGTS